MEEMGMTDLQFKAYLRGLVRALERIREEEGAEEKNREIDRLLKELEATLQD